MTHAHTHTDVTDIYDTAINPEPDDIYDEAVPQPVSSLLLGSCFVLYSNDFLHYGITF